MRHAAGHHGHEFGAGKVGQERANSHRRFRLAHKDAGRNVERLSAAGAHDARHEPRRYPDDKLHNAVVVENCEERAYEDDGGQHLKRENKTDARPLLAQRSKDEFRTDKGIVEHAIGSVSSDLKDATPKVHAQYKNGENYLQAESPSHGLEANGAAVGGEQIGET